MRLSVRPLLLATTLTAAIPAAAVERNSEQVLAFYGSFSYGIPFDLPPFRSLTPSLGAAYNSEQRNGFAGVGWNLSGISTIERASPGRGVPNWNSGDIYMLDGQELYPCQMGSVSPSCTSGGSGAKYSTKVESYARVRFESGSNTWTVTSKTGIRTVYSPVYTAANGGTLRWGQTAVIDTRDNTVSYSWEFSNGDAYLHEISYGPYRVTFYREPRPDVISFATGPALGKTTDRLRSVVVSLQGGSNIRAYAMTYSLSTLTGQSLLTSVQAYGKDVIHSGGVITGGSTLPAQLFTYQTDPVAKSFVDLTEAPTLTPVTENVSWASRTNTVEAGSGNSLQKVNGVSTAWDAGGSSTRALASGSGYVETTAITEPGPWQKRWGLSRDDESVDPTEIDFAFHETPTAIWVMENGVEPLPGTWWAKQAGDVLRIEVSNRKVYYKQNGIVRYESTQVPVYPLRLDASIYQMNTTVSNAVVSGRLKDVEYWCWGDQLLTGDFDGDGRTDQGCYSNAVQTLRVKKATGTGFLAPTVWFTGGLSNPFAGDFNSDGKADVVSKGTWSAEYHVALSNGSGFGALTLWGTASVPGAGCDHNQSVTWTGDFDGNGVLDIACRRAAGQNPGDDDKVLVGLSNGSSFSFSQWSNLGCGAPNEERTGSIDFSGDGRDDYFCISNNGHFYYYLSTGSAFVIGGSYLPPTFCGSSPDYVFGDLNGDGRTDAHCKLNGKVALSTGATFVEQGAYGGWCSGSGESTTLFAADVDGDGASELVCNNVSTEELGHPGPEVGVVGNGPEPGSRRDLAGVLVRGQGPGGRLQRRFQDRPPL